YLSNGIFINTSLLMGFASPSIVWVLGFQRGIFSISLVMLSGHEAQEGTGFFTVVPITFPVASIFSSTVTGSTGNVRSSGTTRFSLMNALSFCCPPGNLGGDCGF